MRKIREVLRLKYEQGRGHRQIAASCGIGVATVSEYLKRARDSGVGWAQAQPLGDAELEARLYPNARTTARRAPGAFCAVGVSAACSISTIGLPREPAIHGWHTTGYEPTANTYGAPRPDQGESVALRSTIS
jgi:hypothetical protein